MLKALLKRMRSNEDGFTLVELLVVIVILGVLVGIGIPTYNGFITRSHEAATKSELAAISNAWKYADIEGLELASAVDTLNVKTLQRYLGTESDGDLTDAGVFLGKYELSYVSEAGTTPNLVEAHVKADLVADTADRVEAWVTKDAIVFDVADITK